MGKSDEYKDFVLDQLADLHGLTCRAMFGGHGLSFRGTFFGIIHRGRLFFKTHPATVSVYRAKKMKPFKPNASQTLKHYYEVPVEIVESRFEDFRETDPLSVLADSQSHGALVYGPGRVDAVVQLGHQVDERYLNAHQGSAARAPDCPRRPRAAARPS